MTEKKIVLKRSEPEVLEATEVKQGLYAKCLIDGKIEWIKASEVKRGTHVMGHEVFKGFAK